MIDTDTDRAYDEALEYTELPMDIVIEQRRQTPAELREYVIGRLALEYVKCVEMHEHDAKAWDRLSKWMHQLVELQGDLNG